MHVSLNEVRTTARKAAIGAGVPVGVADEIAAAADWLCAASLDGVGAVLAGLDTLPDRAAQPERERPGDGTALTAAPVVRRGPSLIDLLLVEAVDGRLVLLDVDAPLLLIGLAGQALERGATRGLAMTLTGAGFEGTVTSGIMTSSGEVPAALDRAVVVLSQNTPADASRRVDGAEVDPDAWRRLAALAARTTVPADPTSRAHGAGAGDIDNE